MEGGERGRFEVRVQRQQFNRVQSSPGIAYAEQPQQV